MNAVILELRVQPCARRTEWGERMADGTRKIRIAAPPEKGKANEELIRFVAAEYGVARDAVEIRAGASARTKLVRIAITGAGPAKSLRE